MAYLFFPFFSLCVLAVAYNRHLLFMRSELSKRNKYWLSRRRYLSLYHFCLQYQEWKDEYATLDGKKAINMDGMPHGSSVGSPTEALGVRRAELSGLIKMIEDTAHETDPMLAKYILRGVTDENATYTYLQMMMDMPCSRNTYYQRKRRFYWLLSKKIKIVIS